MIGDTPPMREIFRVIQKVSRIHCPILIRGETGTGKQLVARAIHETGLLRHGPFLMVHCGLVPEIIETEFFRRLLPAPSGPTHSGSQPSEGATIGTLFLHEITNLPLQLQARIECLLRGGAETTLLAGSGEQTPLAPRIIAATSGDLSAAISEGKFSRDLYFLLNVVSITLPPLRERKTDIPLLAEQILRRLSISADGALASSSPRVLSAQAAERLLHYDWPGNVRELKNYLIQAETLSSNPVIQLSDLPTHVSDFPRRPIKSWKDLQRQAIQEALAAAKGDKLKAAQMLTIGKTTLYRKLHEYEKEG